MKYLVMVGADPELAVRDTNKRKYISAHPYIEGTKRKPSIVPGGAIQHDGVMAEFNITPATNPDQWMDRIKQVVASLSAAITQQNPDATLVAAPVANFDQEYFDELPEEIRALGCDPDFNAWADGAPNAKPDAEKPMRTCGGHVHIGFTDKADIKSKSHLHDCIVMTKQMDVALGIPAQLFDRDRLRRSMYGGYGTFRPKDYGVEYRTLSNAWLSDPRLTRWIYDSVVEAADMLLSEAEHGRLFEMGEFGGFFGRHSDPTRAELLRAHENLVRLGLPNLPDDYLQAE